MFRMKLMDKASHHKPKMFLRPDELLSELQGQNH